MATQNTEDVGLPDMMESLHLDAKSLAPGECKIILEDLKVLSELKTFRPGIGDLPLRAGQYTTMQGILKGLQNLKKCIGDIDEMARWLEEQDPHMSNMVEIPGTRKYRGGPSEMEKQSMERARQLVTHIPMMYQQHHRRLTEILCKLSNNARECLKAGIKIQDIEDAWDLALQEANYSFLSNLV